MIITEMLCFKQLVEIGFHQSLNDIAGICVGQGCLLHYTVRREVGRKVRVRIHIFHFCKARWTQDIQNVNNLQILGEKHTIIGQWLTY